jgi:hypothetical protein
MEYGQHGMIDDLNYYSDYRVICSDHWYESIDETRMMAVVEFYNDDQDESIKEEVSFHWGVCPTCNGKGTHVNPSIDCNGLSASDFHEDPDFAESYFRGDYDQPCNQCNGRRVVPECSDERTQAQIEKYYKEAADCHAERMAEIRMGA